MPGSCLVPLDVLPIEDAGWIFLECTCCWGRLIPQYRESTFGSQKTCTAVLKRSGNYWPSKKIWAEGVSETKQKGGGSREGTQRPSSFGGTPGRTSSRARRGWRSGGLGAQPPSLLLVLFRMLQGSQSCFSQDRSRSWLPLSRFSCKGSPGSPEEGRMWAGLHQASPAKWCAAGWPHRSAMGGRRAGGARPAVLSGYLICSLLGRAALRVCLQLQPVLIIRSEYSSPWAYDKRPKQDGISYFRLNLPLCVCVCVCIIFAFFLLNQCIQFLTPGRW